jgi:hypothetical protein
MPYTSEARNAQYLAYQECGMEPGEAARQAGLDKSIMQDIWKRASEIEISHTKDNLPPLSIKELVAVKPKSGRQKVLSNEDCNKIFATCTVNKKAWKKR